MTMKQRITFEQLQELSDEQKKRLWEWWEYNPGDIVVDFIDEGKSVFSLSTNDSRQFRPSPTQYPLLTIGQMIEFLDPDGRTIFAFCNMIAAEPPIYEASVNGEQFYGANMCDALWEAVKQIL